LEAFGGELDKLRLQKLLFLLTTRQDKPVYDFVPYRFGCFSFHANADMTTLCKYGQLHETATVWKKMGTTSFLSQLHPSDKNIIFRLRERFESATADDMIHYTYVNFPWYALNSTVKEQKLNQQELAAIEALRNTDGAITLFTIGYEGKSVETYLNQLLKNGVKLLCDVRRNPLSMKYGFSKRQLENACTGVSIKYVHLPALGIPSNQRQKLTTKADYDGLFAEYSLRLANQYSDLQTILELTRTYKRIALTCFEADACRCHRGILASTLACHPNWSYPIQHI
jgi:uncharacterized protein (DUF488 family)